MGGEREKDPRIFHPGNKFPPLSLFPYFSILSFVYGTVTIGGTTTRTTTTTMRSKADDKKKKNNERSFTVRVFSPIIIARKREKIEKNCKRGLSFLSIVCCCTKGHEDRILCREAFISRQWIINHTSVHAFCAQHRPNLFIL